MQSLQDFFLFCSGTSRSIINRSPIDKNKYSGIGATIFFTGVFASIAGGFALYTVFQSYFVACIFGLLWGLMIFNLDRYIVMSMKKKGKVFSELMTAFPRLILAVLIAFVIAKPLELKLFQSEINSELISMEQEVAKEQEDKVKLRFQSSIDTLNNDIASLQDEIADKKTFSDVLALAAIQEADGTGGSGRRNLGPIYKAKKLEADKAAQDLIAIQDTNLPLIDSKREAIAEVDAAMAVALTSLRESTLNGFAAQLDALGRLSKKSSTIWWASLFITLLFIAIETAPIFTKLIAGRSSYDYKFDEHETLFETRHKAFTSRLRHQTDADYRFDKEVQKTKTQVAIAAEKEILKDLIGKEVDRLKQEPITWSAYLKQRNVFGSV